MLPADREVKVKVPTEIVSPERRVKWTSLKAASWIVAICVFFTFAALLIWTGVRRQGISSRVYRIGWESNPPFQLRGADGGPTGLAVELVREAARRRGIRLEWVLLEGSEASLRNRIVDLWPLMTITPERLKVIHITDPYLELDLCLLVRADSQYKKVQDLANAAVSYVALPIMYRHAHNHLPNARLVARSTVKESVEDVCEQRTDAAFLQEFTAISALVSGARCSNQSMRMISIPGGRPRLGVGATFEARAPADAIREEIGTMATEGKLAEILAEWGYLSVRNLESVNQLLSVKRRERWLMAAISLFASLFVLTLWQAVRIRRERNRTRQAEQALRETEERFRTIVEMAPDGIYIAGMDGRFLEANQAGLSQLGYSREQLLQQSVVDIVPQRMVDKVKAGFQSMGYADASLESIHLRADGTEMLVELNTRKIVFGGRPAYIGIAREITERKRAEEALRESERRFRGLLENVHLAAVMLDVRGIITFCNDYLLTTTGWTLGEVIGHPVTEFIVPEYQLQVTELIESILQTGQKHAHLENAILTKDGKRRWIQWSSAVLHTPAGQINGFASLGVDVTEHRALQEQYLQSQKLESIGRLAGGVAHDFNNLLTVINGYSDILLSLMHQRDPLRPQIEQIRKAGERAAGLTQQLLAFSRKQVTQPRPLDLNTVVADSEAMFRRLLGEDIELATNLSPSLGQAMADPSQIHQVLMNLLVNARDAMPDGGKLVIETANVELDHSSNAGHSDVAPGPYVLLAVTDTGIGMDEETRSLIFEPFFTTKGKGKGTGLGLSTVYGIVRQNQGWIWVDSESGKGSTFKIYLPRMDVGPPAGEAVESAPTMLRGSETVLIVEDQDDVRRLATTVLRSQGYRVLEAANGSDALALAGRHLESIHLVLSDVVLPGMNGRELAERLRILHPEVKVLYTSGYTEDVIAHRGVLDSGLAYIPKPYTPSGLVAKVREVLCTNPDPSGE